MHCAHDELFMIFDVGYVKGLRFTVRRVFFKYSGPSKSRIRGDTLSSHISSGIYTARIWGLLIYTVHCKIFILVLEVRLWLSAFHFPFMLLMRFMYFLIWNNSTKVGFSGFNRQICRDVGKNAVLFRVWYCVKMYEEPGLTNLGRSSEG